MQNLVFGFELVGKVLNTPLFELGGSDLTVGTLLYLSGAVLLLFYVSARLQGWISGRALSRTRLDIGARHAIGSVTRYAMLILGLLIILQTAGINLTTLNVLAGAVGVGIGFGLQTVVANFVCGLIIMFERPIKIGDRVVVDSVDGVVTEIGARSTKVLSNDNITIIVPNTKFITENVTNWQYNDPTVRFRIPVGVAYGSDVRLWLRNCCWRSPQQNQMYSQSRNLSFVFSHSATARWNSSCVPGVRVSFIGRDVCGAR